MAPFSHKLHFYFFYLRISLFYSGRLCVCVCLPFFTYYDLKILIAISVCLFSHEDDVAVSAYGGEL